jgi:hypothetical protein
MGETYDTVSEKQEILFLNGGWDVHHHIFERTRDCPQSWPVLIYRSC